MNTSELSALLKSIGAPTNAYSIGSDVNEAYCLVQDQGSWHVYYSERGHRNDERTFADEGRACQELLEMLLSDGLVREQMKGSGLPEPPQSSLS